MPYEHIKAYFSPKQQAEFNVMGFIDRTKLTLDFAVFTLTSPRVYASLSQATIDRKVKVRGLVDAKQYRTVPAMKTNVDMLVKAGCKIALAHTSGLMHSKYAISDGIALLTGSYNWTVAAEQRNDENFVIVRKRDRQPVKLVDSTLKAYFQNFESMWNEVGILLL